MSPVNWSVEKKRQKQGERGDTDTSVIILTCGTTNALGSVVWRFENKSFLTQENQVKGNSWCHFTRLKYFFTFYQRMFWFIWPHIFHVCVRIVLIQWPKGYLEVPIMNKILWIMYYLSLSLCCYWVHIVSSGLLFKLCFYCQLKSNISQGGDLFF